MKLFVWDFHGTLEQGNELSVMEISNRVLEERGFEERFSEVQCKELYGKKWFEYFEYLLPKESTDTHKELQEACWQFQKNNLSILYDAIRLADYALEVLNAIAEKHDQILVSNTQTSVLRMFTDSVGISHLFPEGKAFGTHSVNHTMTKYEIVRDYFKENAYDEIITIGDTEADVAFGLALGATTFLYAHAGYEFKKCDHEPQYKIQDLREVLHLM